MRLAGFILGAVGALLLLGGLRHIVMHPVSEVGTIALGIGAVLLIVGTLVGEPHT